MAAQCDVMVGAMLEHLSDGEKVVRESLERSIIEVAVQRPDLVVEQCCRFLESKKGSSDHRVAVLQLLGKVVERHLERLSEGVCSMTLKLAAAEMVASRDVVADLQGASSSLLVCLGKRLPDMFMTEMLTRFGSGGVQLPHFYIMKSLGDFATASPLYMCTRLKELFARILPMLQSIKQDNLRWVFTYTLGKFCEAIKEKTAAAGVASDENDFSDDVVVALDLFLTQWLARSDAKLHAVVLQTVAQIVSVMRRARFDSFLPKMVPQILPLMRKELEGVQAVGAMTSIFQTAAVTAPSSLQPFLLPIVKELNVMTQAAPSGSDSPALIRLHTELLRCWEALALCNLNAVLDSMFERINTGQGRLGALHILKHLIPRLDTQLQDRKATLLSGIKPALGDPAVRVRMSVCHLAVTLARHKYLELEGGLEVIRAVVVAASVPDAEIAKQRAAKLPPGEETLQQQRDLAERTIDILASTIDGMDRVLWPHMLQFIVPASHSPAVAVIAKSIATLARRVAQTDQAFYLIDFDNYVNLPTPQAIVARCFVLLSSPQRRGNQGVRVLELMDSLAYVLHASTIPEIWSVQIPRLVDFLQAGDTFKAGLWEDALLRVFAQTLQAVNEDEWIAHVVRALIDQMPGYVDDPTLKSSSLRFLGVGIQHCRNFEFVKNSVDKLFVAVNHSNTEERLGLAQAMGFAASSHLDIVLERLRVASEVDLVEKKSSGLFSFMKSEPKEIPFMKISIVLCLGFVAARADVKLATSRIETAVLPILVKLIPRCKTDDEKLAGLRCLDLIGKTCTAKHLGQDYVLRQRDQLVDFVVQYSVPNMGAELKCRLLGTATTFAALPPAVPWETAVKVVEVCMSYITAAPAPAAAAAASASAAAATPTSGAAAAQSSASPAAAAGASDRGASPAPGSVGSDASPSAAAIGGQVFEAMCEYLRMVLSTNMTISAVDTMLQQFERLVVHQEARVRAQATAIVHDLLGFVLESLTASGTTNVGTFAPLARWLALFAVRCADSDATVRSQAALVLQDMCQLSDMMQASSTRDLHVAFGKIGTIAAADDAGESDVFRVAAETAKGLSRLLLNEMLAPVLNRVLEAMGEKDGLSAASACLIANGLFRYRGGELQASVGDLVPVLLTAASNAESRTADGALLALKTLARHHCAPVLDALLAQKQLPTANNVARALRILAADSELKDRVVTHVCDVMVNTALFDERVLDKGRGVVREQSHLPMSSTCALAAVFAEGDHAEPLVNEHLAHIVACTVLRLGAAHQATSQMAAAANGAPPAGADAPKHAVELLKAISCATKCESLVEFVNVADNRNKLATRAEYTRVLQEWLALYCQHFVETCESIAKELFVFLHKLIEGFRTAATAAVAVLLRFNMSNRDLAQMLVNSLLARLADDAVDARLLAYAGLANITYATVSEMGRYAAPVLSALVNGLDDKVEGVAVQAFKSLSKIVEASDENAIASVLVNLSMKLKPAYTRGNAEIRAAAYDLFGSLSKFASSSAAYGFYEQLHVVLPYLILHMNEDSKDVQKACRIALYKVSLVLGSAELCTITAPLESSAPANYNEWLEQLCPVLVRDFAQRVNFYLMSSIEFHRSAWVSVRANAARLTGWLLHVITADQRRHINTTQACVALVTLLQQEHPGVRAAAADAMSLLYEY